MLHTNTHIISFVLKRNIFVVPKKYERLEASLVVKGIAGFWIKSNFIVLFLVKKLFTS